MARKIPQATAAPIMSRFDLSDAAAALDLGTADPVAAARALHAAEAWIDLAGFLAHALPVREGLAWAAVLVAGARRNWPARDRAAIAATHAWALAPEEAERQRLGAEAEAIGLDRSAGWLAMAVFWCGSGSITPAGQPAVLPRPYLHAKALTGAVGLAPPPGDAAEAFYARVLDLGLEVAQGAWPGLAPALQPAGA